MEALGILAAGVAHDFNNLVTAILGYTHLLAERLPEDSDLHEEVSQIRKATESAGALTRQLLAFARKQKLAPARLDLNEVVSNLRKIVQRLAGEKIAVQTVLDGTIGDVLADASQIEQVILNLAVNALDAMPDGGTLTIETCEAYLEGPCVLLCVSDTGTGMDAETKARVFEPFFTTKAQGKGTGLGLATVYGIVQQSGGRIVVQSETSLGTTFEIYLPRLRECPAS